MQQAFVIAILVAAPMALLSSFLVLIAVLFNNYIRRKVTEAR